MIAKCLCIFKQINTSPNDFNVSSLSLFVSLTCYSPKFYFFGADAMSVIQTLCPLFLDFLVVVVV